MIALYNYEHDIEMNGVRYSYPEFFTATSAPLPYDMLILDRIPKCKTYKEKKEFVRDQAITYSHMRSVVTNLSWYDLSMIQSYFEKYGKRYGLLTEFKENGIC